MEEMKRKKMKKILTQYRYDGCEDFLFKFGCVIRTIFLKYYIKNC